MGRTHHWTVFFDRPEVLESTPFLYAIGGGLIKSPVYRHAGPERTDLPHYVFQYSLSGTVIFEQNGQRWEVKAGEGFLSYSHDPSMVYYYPANASEPYEPIFWVFRGQVDVFRELSQKYGPIYRLNEDAKSLRRVLSYRTKAPDSYLLTQQAVSENVEMVYQLFADLLAAKEEKTVDHGHDFVKRVEKLMAEHPEARYTVTELSRQLEVSRGYFSRVFKETLGVSPAKYIEERRMQYAGELLKSTTLTVSEVAFKLGFDQPGQFGRSFKRVMGCTPGQFRN